MSLSIIVVIVGEKPSFQGDGFRRDVFQFNPVASLIRREAGIGIGDHDLVDLDGAGDLHQFLQFVVGGGGVLIPGSGIETRGEAAVRPYRIADVGGKIGADQMADDLALRILKIEVFPDRERERCVEIGGAVLPGGKCDKVRISGQQIRGENKPVFSLAVGQTPAGEVQILSGIVVQLDPVGKIPLLILYDGMILDHYFGNNEISGVSVGYSHVIGRSGEGKREAEKACRDYRQRSAEKMVNSF